MKRTISNAVYRENHFNSNAVLNIVCQMKNRDKPHLAYIKTVIYLEHKFDTAIIKVQ